ncbi:MAG: GntR family transcriptional regulator, transcriptional repressor for pyruvate dehydrogenase complex [Pseudonocardiales bacterium]|jgi:DNA-binding FadR family transcriptional regulator|nr:GntR family transcriptional regulator, transcriptional repressor for pyruvate dehydrogenase complex [Pseudonocardiales bacterium]
MSLTDDAIDKIKAMILDGRLKPGSRLPREADLSKELGISRNSLREAVRALSLIRVVDVRQGDGTYVTSLQPSILMETLGFMVDFHQNESVLHLFEVRRALEPAAAERAAVLMTDAEAEGLLLLLDALGESPDLDELIANDVEFHHRIAQGSGNPVLCSLIDGLSGRTQRARTWRGITQADAISQTLREHRAIATAIRQRQPDVAGAWARAHIAGVEHWLRFALQDEDAPDLDGIE